MKLYLKFTEVVRKNVGLFAGSGLLTMIRLGASLLLLKLVALIGGSAAIAIYGQAHNIASMMNGIAASGAGQGVVKMTAQNQGDQSAINGVKSASLALILIFTALIIAIAGMFWEILVEWASIGTPSSLEIIAFTIGALLASVGTLLVSVSNGLQRLGAVVKTNLVAIAISMIFTAGFLQLTQDSALTAVPAIYLGIIGACQISMLFAYFKWPTIDWKLLRLPALKELSGFALMAIGSSFMTPAALITVRGWLIADYGAESAGDWESSRKILELVTTLMTSYFAMVLLPQLAKVVESKILRKTTFEAATALVAMSLVAFAFIYVFRHSLFSIIFNSNFSVSDELLVSRALGEFLRVPVWIFGFILVVRAEVKLYLITGLLNMLIIVASSRLMIDAYGVIGANYAYAMSNGFMLIVSLAVFKKLTSYNAIGA